MTELWTPADIREHFQVKSRDTVTKWQARDGFPAPVAVAGVTRIYDATEVRAWYETFKGDPRKADVLKLWRSDPQPSKRQIAIEVGISSPTVHRWLKALGAL